MRVIAGKYKSRQLKTVDSRKTRPTTDKNKENLFNMIGPYFEGGVCLDLFGGSGGLGIEALSRGMDELYVVDHQYKAYSIIKENIASLRCEDHAHVYKMDYRKALNQFSEEKIKFDLVLLDPPYHMGVNKDIIMFLYQNDMLDDECIIVVEDEKEEAITLDEPFYLRKRQFYGKTVIQIFRFEV